MAVSDGKAREALVSLRLDESLRVQLERIAKGNDRTLSAEIRQALRAHVAAELKEAA